MKIASFWKPAAARTTLLAAVATLFITPIVFVSSPASAAAPAELSLPWLTGEEGKLSSGCHTWDGTGTGCSSLDFIPDSTHVRAPADGTVKLEGRSYFVRLVFDVSWSVSFFHLDNIPDTLTDGKRITRGTYLGDISTLGGDATGPHTHVTLWRKVSDSAGTRWEEASWNGSYVGGYKISTTGADRQACMTDFLTDIDQCVTVSSAGPMIRSYGGIGYGCPEDGCIMRSRANDLLVSAELGYADTDSLYGMLRARSSSGGDWERFTISGDCRSTLGCVIKSKASDQYVTAELDYAGTSYGMLRARSDTAGTWERYAFLGNCRSTTGCAIKSRGNNKFIAAELEKTGDNYGMLRARSTDTDGWERFGIR